MEGEVEADVGLEGDVATIDDGPQLTSSPERAHSGVCDPTRSSPAVSEMAEKGRNDIEAQDEGAIEVSEEKNEAEEESEEMMAPIDRGHTTSGREGKQLGDDLMLAVQEREDGRTKEEAVGEFVATNNLLKGAVEKYPFVEAMLAAIIENKLHRMRKVEGAAKDLEKKDGKEIGESLASTLATTTEVQSAVDEWMHQFPALKELDEEYGWFRPLLETIGFKLMEEVPWGVKMRVTVGAFTSMTDLLTDVYVTYMFWSDKKYGYFKASLASLVASIGLQMLFVSGQNKKLGMKRVGWELIPILLGYRPAVDAYRVATGAKHEAGAVVKPMYELTGMKVVEMFAEAIPGVIIQLMAIATSDKEVGITAWLSVAVSAITTGFASATISYDWDTSPSQREMSPDFYGYIPAKASKRTVVFVSMLLLSAGMLLIRCTTIVLLGLMGGSWAFLYIGADLGLYLLVKILRGDFWYWPPLGGNIEIVSSIFGRVVIKIITDFTSIMQFRHPGEVGGAYWLFGLALTMVSLIVTIYIYLFSPYVDDNPIHIASFIVKYIIPITIICFAVFFFNIESKYLHTFWSTQKSKDKTMVFFLEGESDAMKREIFWRSRHQWVSIEGEVKKWVESNWAKWEEEQPEWFTDVAKAKVPVDFIPADGGARRRESVRRASVDADAEGGLAGALRASIRRASVGGADGGVIIGVGGGKVKVSSVLLKEDGKKMGKQLMQRLKEKKQGKSKVVVKDFISSNEALKVLVEQNKFVGSMLCAVVRNKLKRDAAKEGLNENEEEAKGWKIGSELTKTMSVTTSVEEAISVWAEKHSEVQEVMREHGWLRQMLKVVVKELYLKTNFGLKARVMAGAVLSMTDLLTDVYVTNMFWRGKKYGYFKASLASLVMSIGIQMLFVWGQNKKLGITRVVREWIPILLGYKPAVDAYRVATGAKQEVGIATNAMVEMTFMKCTEMFAEAIPGVIIQLMAIATSDKEVGTSAWLSVAVSAITTGFASATISYDWDTDPANREKAPNFYGYIPAKASKRTVVFVSMLLLSAGMLLIRCTTIVLLGLMGGSWAFLYIGADLGLYLLVKILRGDFWYWVPLGGNIEIVSSILMRVVIKIITDFTSIVQFRHPNEVGGAYWLFGLVLTMGSLPVSIYIYLFSPYVDDNPIDIASFMVKYIIPITTICLGVFFFNIERKYLHTFWSTQKSKDFSMAYFLEGKSDTIKFRVLTNSRHQWISIEGEVKKWVESNWAKWEEEQPEWFTDVAKAKVPVDFIPADGGARRRESVRRASVDADAEGGLAGALRVSMRRASVGGADGGDIIGVGGGKAKVSSVVPLEDMDGE